MWARRTEADRRVIMEIEAVDRFAKGDVVLKVDDPYVLIKRVWTGCISVDAIDMGETISVTIKREFQKTLWADTLPVEEFVGFAPFSHFVIDCHERPFPDVWTSLCWCIGWWLSKGEIVGESASSAARMLLQYGLAHEERFEKLFRKTYPAYWWFNDEEPRHDKYKRLAGAMSEALDAQKVLDALAEPE